MTSGLGQLLLRTGTTSLNPLTAGILATPLRRNFSTFFGRTPNIPDLSPFRCRAIELPILHDGGIGPIIHFGGGGGGFSGYPGDLGWLARRGTSALVPVPKNPLVTGDTHQALSTTQQKLSSLVGQRGTVRQELYMDTVFRLCNHLLSDQTTRTSGLLDRLGIAHAGQLTRPYLQGHLPQIATVLQEHESSLVTKTGEKQYQLIRDAGSEALPNYRSLGMTLPFVEMIKMAFDGRSVLAKLPLGGKLASIPLVALAALARSNRTSSATLTGSARTDLQFAELPRSQQLDLLRQMQLSALAYRGVQDRARDLPRGMALPKPQDLPEELEPFYNPNNGLLILPKGCKALITRDGDGFNLSFAGTEPGSFSKTGRQGTLLTDLVQWANGFAPMYQESAGVARLMFDRMTDGMSLKVSGHSLGGGLAQASTTANIVDHEDRISCSCFNSAGLGTALLRVLQGNTELASPHITHIRVAGDPVSAGSRGSAKGGMIGKVITLDRPSSVSLLSAHFGESVLAAIEEALGDFD